MTLHDNTAIVAVPDDYTRKRLEDRVRGDIEHALTDRFGHDIQLAVTVDPSLHTGAPEAAPAAIAADEPLLEAEPVSKADSATCRQID